MSKHGRKSGRKIEIKKKYGEWKMLEETKPIDKEGK